MSPDAPCTCDGPGDCERAGRRMTLSMHERCKSDACYRWLLARVPHPQWPESCRGPANASPPTTRRPECIHLGTVIDRTDANGQRCGCSQKWLYGCDVHGQCTTAVPRPGVKCCDDGCDDYADQERQPIAVRHLCYHIYPVSGNGAWQRNVGRLVERLRIFNGKRIVTIVVDPPEGRKPDPDGPFPPDRGRMIPGCDSAADVIAAFGEHAAGIEFIVAENDPQLREAGTLIPMLERLPDAEGHATLYAQAKGTTRHPGHIANHWSDVQYIVYLDYWKLVEKQLQTRAATGAFKKLGPGWSATQAKSDWHWSGSWAWFRNSELFARDWRRVDQFWSGIEPYFSQQFLAREAGCLFHEAAVPAMNLYRAHYWRKVVDPAFAKWRADNVRHFNATHGI